jgi:hypothetical protein
MSTTFPTKIQTFKEFEDVTATDGSLISMYQRYVEQGSLTEANSILTQIPDYKQKIITAEDLNSIVDTCTALQNYAVNKYSIAYIVSRTQPTTQKAGDFWLKIED